MSESQEIQEAAATGAAAAVNAVQDEQAEAERAASMEASTAVSEAAASEAAQVATEAAEDAQRAAEAATEAVTEAHAASAEAAEASEEAWNVRAGLEELGEHVRTGFSSLSHLIETNLINKNEPSDQPTEVVVTDARDQTAEQRSDTGGSGGTQSVPESERRRHLRRRRVGDGH